MTNAPKHIQEAFNAIIGNPPRVSIPRDYDPNCLYQAFVSAISVFANADHTPPDYLDGSYKSLLDRVSRSKQTRAQQCLEAFQDYYKPEITNLLQTSTPARRSSRTAAPSPRLPGRR